MNAQELEARTKKRMEEDIHFLCTQDFQQPVHLVSHETQKNGMPAKCAITIRICRDQFLLYIWNPGTDDHVIDGKYTSAQIAEKWWVD